MIRIIRSLLSSVVGGALWVWDETSDNDDDEDDWTGERVDGLTLPKDRVCRVSQQVCTYPQETRIEERGRRKEEEFYCPANRHRRLPRDSVCACAVLLYSRADPEVSFPVIVNEAVTGNDSDHDNHHRRHLEDQVGFCFRSSTRSAIKPIIKSGSRLSSTGTDSHRQDYREPPGSGGKIAPD